MSVITFRLPRGAVEALWGLVAAANVAVMVLLESWETIPLGLAWLSVTLLYGARHAGRHRAVAEELRRTRRERDLMRDASHELRTPITVARGHAELILQAHPRSPVVADVMVIADELQRMSAISERLLMLSTAEQPGFVDLAPVDLAGLVESTVMRWRPVAPRRWEARVDHGDTVLVDRERIECALDALIENAVKATSEDDLIAITAMVNGDEAIIDVIDEGAGIAPGDLPRVLERSYSGGSYQEGNGGGRNGGTGLGLAIVKAIAEAHGGSVTVSRAAGKGTILRLRLNGRTVAPRGNHNGGNGGRHRGRENPPT